MDISTGACLMLIPEWEDIFLWSYNDYARGAEQETMFCGIVDINRYPKFSYYMMQSMRDKEISQPGLYDGPMVFIASQNTASRYVSSVMRSPYFPIVTKYAFSVIII